MDYHVQLIKKRKLLMFLYYTKTVRFFKDGDGISGIFNVWNPLTYILAPILFLLFGVLDGFPNAIKNKHEIGLGLSPYWLKNKHRIEWL